MRKIKLPAVFYILLISAVLIAAVKAADPFFEIKKQLTIFSDVFKEITTEYVEEVSPESLMKTGINAMLEKLDPYTVFIDEGQQQQMEIFSTGNYGGIGLEAGFRGPHIVVIAPMEGYPAHKAGILPGDLILEINGLSTESMTPEEVQQLTTGDIGTEVTLKIQRPGIEEEMEYTLKRERIEVKNISFAGRFGDNDEFAYIQLSRFGQNTAEEVREQLIRFDRELPMEGLILDLRNNPGGLLNESVQIVDKFVEPGVTIVETRGRFEPQNNVYATDETPLFEDLPLVVLINSGSASASEIVSGAFQDLDRAVVVGEKSFGKGLVQIVKPLSYDTSLKITVSKYFIPSGRSIQAINYNGNGFETGVNNANQAIFKTKNGRTVYGGNGIVPDVEIEQERPSLLETALMQRNHYFFFINDYINTHQDQEYSEKIFDEFVTYLSDQNFDYQTEADRQIASLENNLQMFSDSGVAENHLAELEKMIQQKKKDNILRLKESINQTLKYEWMSRTSSSSDFQKSVLESDDAFLKAIDLLKKPDEYSRILKP